LVRGIQKTQNQKKMNRNKLLNQTYFFISNIL